MAGLPKRSLANGLHDEVEIQDGNEHCNDPGNDPGNPAVDKTAHLGAGAGEVHQRHDGEDEGEGQDDLAEYQQTASAVAAADGGDDGSGDDGDGAGDEAAQPGLDSDFEEALHDNLAGESADDGGVLAAGEQADAE